MNRKAISKKLRFEVFKRDSFACQYCGKRAPDVVLHCDHIEPVAKGGGSDILNLITSCEGCNAGKSDRRLNDDAVVTKQHAQMTELQARRQQIEMMAQWRAELHKMEDASVVIAEEAWSRHTESVVYLNDYGLGQLKTIVKKHGLEATFNGMAGAANSYLIRDDDGKFTIESCNNAFSMIGRVITVQKRAGDKPYLPRMYYARGILRKRLSYVDERHVLSLIEDAITHGADVEGIVDLSRRAPNWSHFRGVLEDFVANAQTEEAEGGNGSNS